MTDNYTIEKSSVKTPQFIGAYQMPDNICDELVNYFEKNKRVSTEGVVLYNNLKENISQDKLVDHSYKQSFDLKVGPEEIHFPIWDFRQYLQKSLREYMTTYTEINNLSAFNINENYQIQKYPVGGGFKQWHYERTGPVDIGRHLVFMTYLNDVEDGGTMFKYQDFTCPAKKGLTIIWPADWTFTHKGQVSNTKEKYIITGWYSSNA